MGGWEKGRVNTSMAKASVGPHALRPGWRDTHAFRVSTLRTSHITHVTCSREQHSCFSSHTLPHPPPFHALPLLTLSRISPSLSHGLQAPGAMAASSQLLCWSQRLQLAELGLG